MYVLYQYPAGYDRSCAKYPTHTASNHFNLSYLTKVRNCPLKKRLLNGYSYGSLWYRLMKFRNGELNQLAYDRSQSY